MGPVTHHLFLFFSSYHKTEWLVEQSECVIDFLKEWDSELSTCTGDFLEEHLTYHIYTKNQISCPVRENLNESI